MNMENSKESTKQNLLGQCSRVTGSKISTRQSTVFLYIDQKQVETGIKHAIPVIVARKKVEELAINVANHSESVFKNYKVLRKKESKT